MGGPVTINLSCGCSIIAENTRQGKFMGADLCELHQKIFARMEQIANGKSGEIEPPNVGDLLGTILYGRIYE